MMTSLKTIAAVTGVLIALTACGADDDGTADPAPTIDTDVASPDDATTAPHDEATDDGCPVLTDAEAAQALGVEMLTMDGNGELCTWRTPDGEPALQVLTEEPSTPGASPEERATYWGSRKCHDAPRAVTVTGGAAVACDAGLDGRGRVFTSDHEYLVSIGDQSANPDEAERADQVDVAAKVIAEFTLPDGDPATRSTVAATSPPSAPTTMPTSAPTTSQPAVPPPTTATGDEGSCSQEISADIGTDVGVIDDLCVDGWAYIDACPGCGGDTQQVARLVDGSWSVVLAFPIGPDQPRCRADWEAQGMPAAILDRIQWPCTEASSPAPTGTGSPATPDAAAARLQLWIGAYGTGDAATYCDIGGPYFEANGLPRADCPDVFTEFRTEPAEELASLAEATVDTSQAVEVAPGTVEIPTGAIVYPTPISDPGSPDDIIVMTHDGTDWYVTDAPDE